MINYQRDRWFPEVDVNDIGVVEFYVRLGLKDRILFYSIVPYRFCDLFYTTFEARLLKAYFKVVDYCEFLNTQIKETNNTVRKVINIEED